MTKKQVGRKAIGDNPMTASERKSRQREALRASGGKIFSIDVKGEYMLWIRESAKATEKKDTEILKSLVESSIVRFIEINQQAEVLIAHGGTDEQLRQFMIDNMFPRITNPIDYLSKDAHNETSTISNQI